MVMMSCTMVAAYAMASEEGQATAWPAGKSPREIGNRVATYWAITRNTSNPP